MTVSFSNQHDSLSASQVVLTGMKGIALQKTVGALSKICANDFTKLCESVVPLLQKNQLTHNELAELFDISQDTKDLKERIWFIEHIATQHLGGVSGEGHRWNILKDIRGARIAPL